jgi:integrase
MQGMSEDIRVDRELQPPNAFTLEEQDRILEAFAHSRYYSYYLPLVKFWLLTGCRPSEAIGLEWEQVSANRTSIRFDRSIGQVGSKFIKNKRSKTNRVRIFPTNEKLQILLLEINRASDSKHLLVFPSRKNKIIDYKAFSARIWKPLVEAAIGRHSTPYSCRDTFITHQIGQGIPIAVIAKWVDNSVKMIESRYLDPTALDRFKPL